MGHGAGALPFPQARLQAAQASSGGAKGCKSGSPGWRSAAAEALNGPALGAPGYAPPAGALAAAWCAAAEG